MAYIAGAFTATWGGSAIGEVERGFNIEWTPQKRLITGDNQAATPQDAVYRGMEMFVSFTLNEWSATGVDAMIWPYNAAIGEQGTVGVLDSTKWGVLILTAIAGTSAAGVAYTFDRTIIAEGFPVNIVLEPDLRTIPIRLRVYPNATGTGQFYAVA